MKLNIYPLFICVLLMGTSLFSCKPDDDGTDDNGGGTNETNALGWSGDDNMSQVPTNVTYFGGPGNLPGKVDLVPKFPPVGNQGQYGTCVAWAVAYNHKTAINGMDKGLSSSQLSSAANQFSPKDLFLAIPDNEKGPNCGGTDFGSALNILQKRGVATMQTVPYTGLSNCSSSGSNSSWANEASQNRIEYWRKVQAGSVTDIKKLLADNIPLIFGAKLADNFMTWNSEAVLSSNSSYLNVGQHAYHAMVLAGYDDAKGAFKVINSWGKNWGASGYIWVEYNFFLNEFCKNSLGERPIFMAVNKSGGVNPPTPDPVSTGVDLAAWVFSDVSYGFYQGYPQRLSTFNVYNIGNQTAPASGDWSIYCIAFNAYDASDYGVLFSCDVNTSTPPGVESCVDFNTCTYNVNIPPGGNFANGYQAGASNFQFAYAMPYLTGYYYLILYADVFDDFAETDETNNWFYPFLDPKYFLNGQGQTPPTPGITSGADSRSASFNFENTLSVTPENLKHNPHTSLLTKNLNAYQSNEFAAVIKRDKLNGRWAKKLEEMRKRNSRH